MKVLSLITGYVALFLLALICFKPILNRIANKNKVFKKLNSILVRYHILMGILLIVFILLHCKLASKGSGNVLLTIISSACILLSIGCYFIRKKLKRWKLLHLIFAILSLLFAVLHVIDVKLDKYKSDNVSYEVLIDNGKKI